MKFGTILYEVRDALGITNNEYLLLDAVCKLQNNQATPGWCNASAAYLAWVVGISRRNIFPLYDRLVSRNLLEIRPSDSAKRVTQSFVKAAITGDVASLYDETSLVMPRHRSGDVTSLPPVMLHHQSSDVASPNNTDNTVDRTFIVQSETRAQKKQPSSKSEKTKKASIGRGGPAAPRETAVPFAQSPFAAMTLVDWCTALNAACADMNIPNIDTAWYYGRVRDWSATKGARSADWIATARTFILSDQKKNALVTIQSASSNGNSNSTTTNSGNHTAGNGSTTDRAAADRAATIATAARIAARRRQQRGQFG